MKLRRGGQTRSEEAENWCPVTFWSKLNSGVRGSFPNFFGGGLEGRHRLRNFNLFGNELTLKTTILVDVFVILTFATREFVAALTSKRTSELGFNDRMSRTIGPALKLAPGDCK